MEYAMIVNTAELRPGMADATSQEVAQTFADVLGRLATSLTSALPDFRGGGWDVVSHQITRIDRHVVVSFLVRRDER